MLKIKLLCITITISGICLFSYSYILIPSSKPIFMWCIGLAAALIILGLGYFIKTLLLSSGIEERKPQESIRKVLNNIPAKERAGYLVCKIMYVLLCLYIFIINEARSSSIILTLGIILLLIQFALDLLFQIYFYRRKDD